MVSGTPLQVGVHIPLRESHVRIYSPQIFMKPLESIWPGRGYASTTARRSPILKATSMYFATANVLQYSQKIYTRIVAPTWPSFNAAQERGLSIFLSHIISVLILKNVITMLKQECLSTSSKFTSETILRSRCKPLRFNPLNLWARKLQLYVRMNCMFRAVGGGGCWQAVRKSLSPAGAGP